jgi:hypothetical protein
MILALVLFLNHSGLGQGLIISPATSFIGIGGNIILRGNVVNDGSFSNNNNKVIFTGAVQSLGGTSPVLFNNLTVAAGSTTTMITAGQTLKGILVSNSTLNANGNITLLSTVTQTALIDGIGAGQVNGNVIMQRYLPSGFGYKYFSSPFQAATVSEFGDDMNLAAPFTSFYSYDEGRTSSGWVSYINPAWVLNPMRGYAVNFGSSAIANTVDVTGIVNNGSLSLTLYNHNNLYTKGLNLIGNPYPSPIDWNALSGWTKTNIDSALYYFTASTTDQFGGTYSSYIKGISSDGIATNIIPSMQGFFVHVSDGTWPVTGTLTFNNNVRLTDQTHPFIKSESQSEKSFLLLVAGYSDDSTSYDPLAIYFDEKATYNFDGQLDALKLFNTDRKVTNFYSFGNDGRMLSINALPMTEENLCTVRLGIKTERNGDVIFKIRNLVGDFFYKTIYFSDVITKVNQDLLPDKQYRVNLNAGDYQDRFFLNLSNSITYIPDLTPVGDWIDIYATHGILKAEIKLQSCEKGTLTIYNLLGQPLNIYKIYRPGHHEFCPLIRDGIYIVTFNSGDIRISKKVFMQSQ